MKIESLGVGLGPAVCPTNSRTPAWYCCDAPSTLSEIVAGCPFSERKAIGYARRRYRSKSPAADAATARLSKCPANIVDAVGFGADELWQAASVAAASVATTSVVTEARRRVFIQYSRRPRSGNGDFPASMPWGPAVRECDPRI